MKAGRGRKPGIESLTEKDDEDAGGCIADKTQSSKDTQDEKNDVGSAIARNDSASYHDHHC